MMLRTGYTTGACATAAAKAATMALVGRGVPESVEITLPDGGQARFAVIQGEITGDMARASVRKDAGDDPDVTHLAVVTAEVRFSNTGTITFRAGDGVGTVTKPGLALNPGEPAINPVPRRMIAEAVREMTMEGVEITISIPGGRELAERTFNPRLGITGGLSVIGTTGIVKPFSAPAITASLQIALDVAAASGIRAPVLVPGNIGERAAMKNLPLCRDQIIQASNHWGFILDAAIREPRFDALFVLGHPGKLAKLTDGEWDTHSSNSASATGAVARVASALGFEAPESGTVEGIFAALDSEKTRLLGDALAASVHRAIIGRTGTEKPIAVGLVNLAGDWIGTFGNFDYWQ